MFCDGCLATVGAPEQGPGPAPVSGASGVRSSDKVATERPSGTLYTSMADLPAQTTLSAESLKQRVSPEPLLVVVLPEGATVKSSESTVIAASQPFEALATAFRALLLVFDHPIDSTGVCTLNCMSARRRRLLLPWLMLYYSVQQGTGTIVICTHRRACRQNLSTFSSAGQFLARVGRK